MAEIIINEVSQNYSYNIGSNSFATVALPITACWGPGFEADVSSAITEDKFEALKWNHFPATQAGLEAFVAMYRGAATIYRTAKDYSYQMAMSLLSAGYDVLVCRVAPGAKAQGVLTVGGATFTITAKYTGTFGNNLKITIAKNPLTIGSDSYYYNVIVYVEDISGIQTALENLSFVTNELWSTDVIPYIDELESNFIEIVEGGATTGEAIVKLVGGTDYASDSEAVVTAENLRAWYNYRYGAAYHSEATDWGYGSETLKYETNTIQVDTQEVEVYRGFQVESKLPGSADNVSVTLATHNDINSDVDVVFDLSTSSVSKGEETFHFYIDNPATTDTKHTYTQLTAWATYAANKYYTHTGDTYDVVSSTEAPAGWGEAGTGYEAYYTQDATAYIPLSTLVSENVTVEVADAGDSMGDNPTWVTTVTQGIDGTQPSYVSSEYGLKLYGITNPSPIVFYKQTIYSLAYKAYDALKDKLSYNPQRYISPGWDDQDIAELGGDTTQFTNVPIISALHIKLMDVGYYGRCGTAYIDIPKALPRRFVYNETDTDHPGYAQKLARFKPVNTSIGDVNGPLYTSHSALFAPWGQYTYVGTTKQATASPSFITLLIQRAMILNQSLQYEWALPTNRRHNLRLGKFDYSIPAHLLKSWQKLSGVGVNCLTSLPDLGNTLWGNSTLFEVPPAVYQALANLSTRFLVNAVEDIAYRCGIAITFQYNNGQAYDKFYAGVTPLLDTMKNVGAIDDYYVRMSADINGADQVNANTVIGKVYLVVNGVINDIIIDLVALPPQTDLSQFAR